MLTQKKGDKSVKDTMWDQKRSQAMNLKDDIRELRMNTKVGDVVFVYSEKVASTGTVPAKVVQVTHPEFLMVKLSNGVLDSVKWFDLLMWNWKDVK